MPPIWRVGDFDHAGRRFVNCFSKRLHSEVKGWGGNGLGGATAWLAQLQDCYKEVIAENSRISAAKRLTLCKKREGACDLTLSKVFLTSHPNMQKVVAAVHRVVGARVGGEPPGVVVHLILLPFYRLYGFWGSKVYLSDAALAAAKEVWQIFAHARKNIGWVPATWVHWVACYFGVFLSRYHNRYMFSTIPSEKKHSAFKLELGHVLRGWSITDQFTRDGVCGIS